MEQIELEAKLPPSSTHASATAADCGRGRGGGGTEEEEEGQCVKFGQPFAATQIG